jgi:phosphoribosylformimino-5-aminoimidazole carboxamide ribotide isomerase
MQLIPAIDLLEGQCVRLAQGNFDRQRHYASDAPTLLSRYARLGARWVHVVDLDGARDGARGNQALIARMAAGGALQLQVGGGVRSRAAIEELLQAGSSRVVVGSAAVEAPREVLEWLRIFGAQRLCLAFDVRIDASGMPQVHTRGWTRCAQLSLWEALAPFAGQLRHVLCTDIARDGMLSGPNLALYAEAQRRHPRLAWQASGGIRCVADLAALAQLGIAAAVSGRALLEHTIADTELLPFLQDASSPALTSATAP